METKRRKVVFMDSFFSDCLSGGRRGEEVLTLSIFPGLVLAIICGSVWAAGGDLGHGDGTQENPYLIEDLVDFDVFADLNNASTYWTDGVHTKLMTDIDLSGRTYTTAVIAPDTSTSSGFQGIPFSGVFDGNNFTLANLSINTVGRRQYLGLFGRIEGLNAEVKNLHLEHTTILGGGISSYVGGLVGEHVSGFVMNCYVNTSIYAYGISGGLAGASSAPISNCYSTGSVAGPFGIGGLVGWNTGPVTNCYSTSTVIAYLIVSVVTSGDFGGLVGQNEGSIQSSFSAGHVSGTGTCGGLIGTNEGEVANCYSTCDVHGSGGVGGLIAWNYGHVKNCYSTGTATSTSGKDGGLIASTKGPSAVLGIAMNCFWDITSSGTMDGVGDQDPDLAGVTGKTTTQMQTRSTFTGWDFVEEDEYGVNEIWRICEDGADYPRLSWEYGRHGDFACPEGVGLEDLEAMAVGWLTADSSPGFNYACDGSGDGFIGQEDFTLLSRNWLIPFVSDSLIVLSKFQFLLSVTQEQTDPILQTLTIENAGIGVLEWTIQTDEPTPGWLSIDPVTGSLQRDEGEPVILTINTAGLSGGFYEYSFEVSDPNAENSPQTVTVKLHINAPTAYWALDETEGITAYDSSGNGHHGTLVNFADPNNSWVNGKIGNCLTFDGSNDYAEAGEYMGIAGTQSRTTCAWIKLSSIGSVGNILSYGSADYRGSWLFMVNGDHKLQLGVNEGNIIGTEVLAVNHWYHVAAVLEDRDRDGLTVDDLRLYIDGEEVPGNYKNPDKGIMTGSVYPVRIGTHVSVNYFFSGLIDEVRMYEAALSEEQIALLASDTPL